MAANPAEKKNRLSRLLGKRDKSPAEPTVPPDSAYASSDSPSAEAVKGRSTSDIVPAEKNSEIANIDKDRNLGVKPSTGEVVDQDTGEVVTVVTTTTTTTTTTTRKPGSKNPDVQKDVQRDVQEQTVPSPVSQPLGPAEMPANTTIIQRGEPAAPQNNIPDRTSSNTAAMAAPSLPHRSLARKSGEYGTSAQAGPVAENLTPEPPVSPTSKHNFSYPSRNRNSMEPDGSNLTTTDTPQRHNGGTMSELKAAAKGLHGVGETLRGTLNSTIDDNFPRRNASKQAAVQAKNEAVLARGRDEISTISSRPEQPRTLTSDQNVPGQWNEYEPDSNLMPDHVGGQDSSEGRKARSIGKLFKRKPVGGDKGELREEKSKSRERTTKFY